MALLLVLHRWVGLTLGLLLLVVGATGTVLFAKGPYYRWSYPELARPVTPQEPHAYAQVLRRIEASFPDATTVKLPQPGMNAFQVWLPDDREAFLDARTGAVVDIWHWSERLPAFLFELHAHLLGGATGLVVNGLLAALTVAFLALGGTVLWWPRRRAVALSRVAPRRWTPGELVHSHTAVGVLILPALLLFLLTGLAVAWASWVMPAFSALLDAPGTRPPPVSLPERPPTPIAWDAVLAQARAEMPDGQLVFVSGGRAPGVPVTFRVRLPGEWHPNGRSLIVLDPVDGRVLATVDARALGPGTRLGHAMYPLHAARLGESVSVALVAAGVVAGLGLCWLAASGATAWWKRWRAAEARRSRRAVA
jgi:uncharacterized iron-regulated membrane protein